MVSCKICRQVDEAIALLDGISFRGRMTDDERLPAWRAIKLLYRAGASKEDCQDLVDGIRKLGMQHTHGPTLRHHLNRIGLLIERQRQG